MGVYKNNSGTLDLLAGGTLYADNPIGSIVPFGGDSAPNGWLLCQGQAISRTTYSDLFAVIGTSFGSGNGTTTFNIPDLRGEFLRGAGTNSHSGQGNGGSVGTHQDSSSLRVTYVTADNNFWIPQGSGSEMVIHADGFVNGASSLVKGQYSPGSTGSGPSSNVRPTNTSVNYIIKVLQVALPADFESAFDDKIADNIVDSIADGNMKAVTSNAVYDAILSKISTLGANYYDSKTGLSFTAGIDQSITHSIANVPAGKYSISYRIWNGESSKFSFYNYTDGCGLWEGTWSGTETKPVGKVVAHSGGTFTRASVWRQMLNNNVGQVGITLQIMKVGIV